MAADTHGLQGLYRSQFLSWTWTWHDPLGIPGFSNVTMLCIAVDGSTEICKAGSCQRRPPHRPTPDCPRGALGSTCPALPQRQRSASALPSCGSTTLPSSSALLAARETLHQAEQGRRWVSTESVAHNGSFLTPLLCQQAEAIHIMTQRDIGLAEYAPSIGILLQGGNGAAVLCGCSVARARSAHEGGCRDGSVLPRYV